MPPPPPASQPKKRGPTKGKRRGDDDEYGYAGKNVPLQKPPDQEKLADADLKEEFIRNLNSGDAQRPKNLAVWDYNEKTYIPFADPDPCIYLYVLESELFSRDGEEIKEITGELIDDISDKEEEVEKVEAVVGPKLPTIGPLTKAEVPPPTEEEDKKAKEEKAEEGDDADAEEEKPPEAPSKPKKLLNQFNYCMRASQTANNKLREHVTQTEPPPRASRKDMCNLYIIYDAYEADSGNRPSATKAEGEHKEEEGGEHKEEDAEKKEKPKETKKDKDQKLAERERVKTRKASVIEGQAAVDVAMLKSAETLRYLERFISTNVNDEVIYDFKYFEDSSDDYRENGEGTLLPLWRFVYDKAKKKHVTCISWSESQPDVFAVSYGSFSFVHPVQAGFVVIYSLRNPSFPEHIWMAPKGAMTCHIHSQRDSLICIGLVDGNVAVLNIEKDDENETQSEVLRNNPMEFKHSCPVWSVKWGQDDIDGNPTFYSSGMDGKVLRWTMGVPDLNGLGGLEGQEVATLTIPNSVVSGPDGTSYKLFGCARCIAFHPTEKNNFLVGTSEGKIFRSSSLYGDKFLQIYDAHFLAVAALQWNTYHQEVFLSCSEDWTIKVWDRNDPAPQFIFEVGVPILDVCWAPYSSTVFGAVTSEGKALIFDLNTSRDKPACTQQVVTKKKVHPHRISFNPRYPIVVVGDDRGTLITLKLSPNLRVLPKDTRGIFLEGAARINFECNKMKRILNLVRDPQIITNPKENEIPIVTNLAEIPGALSQTSS